MSGEKRKGQAPEQVESGAPGSGENVCRRCKGEGRIGAGESVRPCPECGGSGKIATPIGGA